MPPTKKSDIPFRLRELQNESGTSVGWKLKGKLPIRTVFATVTSKIRGVMSRDSERKLRPWRSRNPYSSIHNADIATARDGISEAASEERTPTCALSIDSNTPDLFSSLEALKSVRAFDGIEEDNNPSPSLVSESNSDNLNLLSENARETFSFSLSALVRILRSLTCWSFAGYLSKIMPIIVWLPSYSLSKFALDLQSGIVVGCMLVPQSMGYASVALLPVERGLYASFAPLMIYCVFSSSKQMGVGPVAIISLLLAQGLPACSMICRGSEPEINQDPYPKCPETCRNGQVLVYNEKYGSLASACAVISGLVQICFAPILGFVMNFVPHPVIVGFTSGGGLIIAMSQLESIVGFSIRKDRLQDGVFDLLSKLKDTNSLSCGMGAFAILFLLVIKEISGSKLCASWGMGWISKVAKLPWALALVGVYTFLTSSYNLGGRDHGVRVVGHVPGGLPTFSVPFSSSDLTPRLMFLTLQIVLIGYLESIAVETKYGSLYKYQIRPTQEAVALGFANLMSGLTGGYPITGSFSRSATNANYGSQTPMCNMVASILIMFSLLFLTNLFKNMPRNILASIVIVAALSLLDLREAIFLWRSSTKEWILMVFTFVLTGFVALELGILISILLCIAEVLFKSTRPKVALISNTALVVYLPGAGRYGNDETNIQSLEFDIQRLELAMSHSGVLFCRVEGDLSFAAAAQLKHVVGRRFFRLCEEKISCKFIFDLSQMDIIDTTSLDALIALVEEVEARLAAVLIVGIPPALCKFLKIDIVQKRLANVTFVESLHHLLEKMQATNAAIVHTCNTGAYPHAQADVRVEIFKALPGSHLDKGTQAGYRATGKRRKGTRKASSFV